MHIENLVEGLLRYAEHFKNTDIFSPIMLKTFRKLKILNYSSGILQYIEAQLNNFVCIIDRQKRMANSEFEYWDNLQSFLAVARTLSFSHAAKLLGTHQTTVGRRIDALERRLDARLVHRHSRGVTLSNMGKMIQARVESMEASATLIEKETAAADLQMQGTVTITSTEGMGGAWLLPKLKNFQRLNPGIRFILDASSMDRSLAAREADIAIRLNRPPEQQNYIIRRVGCARMLASASEAYLREFGEPKTEDDLRAHYFVETTPMPNGETWDVWRNIIASSRGIQFSSNSAAAAVEAVRLSYGIGITPTYSADYMRARDVVQLQIQVGDPVDVWVVTHTETLQAQRVRATVDYIYQCFEDDRYRLFYD